MFASCVSALTLSPSPVLPNAFGMRMQVGHRFASTTALYTGVSGDSKNQAMRCALRSQLGEALRWEAP